jgi:hypothetical protein
LTPDAGLIDITPYLPQGTKGKIMMATGFLKKASGRLNGTAGPKPLRVGWLAALLVMVLWLIPGCPSPPGYEKLKEEVKGLKTEVANLKEKIIALEAEHKLFMEMLKKAPPSKEPASWAPEATTPGATPGPALQAPPEQATGAPLTVAELFENKEQYLGTRVTVKGVPGPVLMHKKAFFLSSLKGRMVEVLYGNLQDQKQVERLTSQTILTPVTVTGLLSTAPGQVKKPEQLIIMADTVEF